MGPEATEIYISDLHFWGPSIGLTNEKPIGYKEMFIWPFFFWLVVSTPLKNISELGLLFPMYGTITNVPNHQPVFDVFASDHPENYLETFAK